MADLQRRLQEYEEHGVQATLAMQYAARAVSLDNDRLRALLAHHGVSSDEVERFLRFGDGAQDCGRQRADGAASSSPLSSSERCLPDGTPCLTEARQPSSLSVDIQRIALSPHSLSQRPLDIDSLTTAKSAGLVTNVGGVAGIPQERSNANDCGQGLRVCHGDDNGDESPLVAKGPTSPPPASTPDSVVISPEASLMETSCDAAAGIIANVQGHGDKALAFAVLGCSGTKDCVVRNIRIFDLIDRIP